MIWDQNLVSQKKKRHYSCWTSILVLSRVRGRSQKVVTVYNLRDCYCTWCARSFQSCVFFFFTAVIPYRILRMQCISESRPERLFGSTFDTIKPDAFFIFVSSSPLYSLIISITTNALNTHIYSNSRTRNINNNNRR